MLTLPDKLLVLKVLLDIKPMAKSSTEIVAFFFLAKSFGFKACNLKETAPLKIYKSKLSNV